MTEFQKELILMAMCFSFFFGCGLFAENAVASIAQMMTPAVPWILK